MSHYGRLKAVVAPMIPTLTPGTVKKIDFTLVIRLHDVVQLH